MFLFATAYAKEESTTVQQLYEQARTDEQANDLAGAIQQYQQMLRLDPSLVAAYNNLGRLYYQTGRFEDGIAALKHACTLAPTLAAPHALLGFSYFQLGNFAEARHELTTALKLNPEDLKAELLLARSLVALKDLTGALKLLDELRRQDPRNPEVLYTLGTVYSSLAEVTLGEIQQVDPNSYLIDVLLAQSAEASQAYADAATHYKSAIQKAPANADLYYPYAHALFMSGDAGAALAAYRRALAQNPYDYRAGWEAARIVVADNPQESYTLATRALEIKPGNPDSLAIRGQALLALHRPKEAVEDLAKASSLEPEDAPLHFQLARAYRETGQTQEAQNEQAIYKRLQEEAHAQIESKAQPRTETNPQ